MSKTSSQSDTRQNVVVVGGGYAGAPIARQLSKKLDASKYNLILITARPYFTHLIATVRASVTSEGVLDRRILIPYDNLFINGNGTLLVGEVASITDSDNGGHVTLTTGKQVDYSVLILTPGSTWEGPLSIPDTKSEATQWFDNWRVKFEKADDIVLVGGGAVGIG